MHRMKTRASRPDASSSSSNEEDISLGGSQEEAPTPLVPSTDVATSSAVSQHRSSVPSQHNRFSRKYKAHWKDDFSM